MKKFLTKNKKYIGWLLLFAVVLSFVILPVIVLAADFTDAPTKGDWSWIGQVVGWFSGEALLFVSSFISSILGGFFGLIISLEAKIIDYILSSTNFPLTTAPIVTLGWGITRDLANMFFILILLIIAFATVLKIQSYAIKQLWWKVLVAALLINFSLVIAGFVIDFTQVLTQFFLKQITGGGIGTMTTKLAASMQILNFYRPAPPTSIPGGIAQFASSGFAAVAGIILTLVGLVITTFVFGAAMVFLIVRILYLWLLLIFAPIVWMLWILPATSDQFSKWWHSFIQWAFFAPIFVFMIYLSLSMFDATGKFNPKVFGAFPAVWQTPAPGISQVGLPAAIFQWILVIAMMFGSLIVAQKFGVYGADASRKMLEGWGDRSKNWAGRVARRGATAWTQPAPEAPAPGAKLGTRFGYRFRQVGAAIGGVAAATPGVRGQYLKMVGAEQKAYDSASNEYKNIDPAILEQVLRGPLEAPRRLAIQQTLIDKKKLKPKAEQLQSLLDQSARYNREENFLKSVQDKMDEDLTPANGYTDEVRADLIRRALKYGNEDDFAKFFPVIASRVLNKPIVEVVRKIKNPEDIYEDQLNAAVVRSISPENLRDLQRSQKVAAGPKRRKIKDIVDKEFKGLMLPPQEENEIFKIAGITHRDTRNKELKVFLDRQYNNLIGQGVTPEVAATKVKNLSDLIIRRFTVRSMLWLT